MRPALISGVLLLLSVPAAAAADCADVFKFIPNDRLSIQEFSRLAPGEGKEGPNFTVLSATLSDYENAPSRGRWQLWGVVYGAVTDMGGTAIGGTLWTPHREALGSGGGDFRVAKDGVHLTVEPPPSAKDCRRAFVFRLDPKGRLFADGKLVGRAKDANSR